MQFWRPKQNAPNSRYFDDASVPIQNVNNVHFFSIFTINVNYLCFDGIKIEMTSF